MGEAGGRGDGFDFLVGRRDGALVCALWDLLRKTLPLGGLKRENSISAVDLGCWNEVFRR